MSYETIRYEVDGAVALVTLHRPDRANAMNRTVLRELNAACDAAMADDAVRAVVLTGAGQAFCSGFDLKEQAAKPPQGVGEWRRVLRDDFDAIMRFWHLGKPTVAAVNGPALAGGFELAMACDLTVAAEDAVLGEPELQFGAGIVVMLLPYLAGPKVAKEIILLGDDKLPARRAYDLGLVNRLAPRAEVLPLALRLARRMAVMDPMLVRETKRALNRCAAFMGLDAGLEAALDIDTQIEGEGSIDKRRFLEIARGEGLKAALAWRDARFAAAG
ncbi:MAG: enoyl-CoA hydratase/isomerase family protein [Alphaproteobacteria bacterium]|nr:enoyl-CoA hydratase/isomerase family protein [Alphaproteobacteria bacterium]